MDEMPSVGERERRLIQHYFKWEPPHASLAGASPGQRRSYVCQWLTEQIAPFGAAALALMASLQPILEDLRNELPGEERRRFFCRLDAGQLVKTPESVLEKMARSWEPKTGPKVRFDDFHRSLPDLGRFRIVTNFISDAERVQQALEAPYQPPATCGTHQGALGRDWLLEGYHMEDRIHLDPRERSKGERCIKGVFSPRRDDESYLRVEVQIVTLLQEAWDKKDHFLVYEPRRRGEAVSPAQNREIFAISELLYIADLSLDRLRHRDPTATLPAETPRPGSSGSSLRGGGHATPQ